MQADLTVLENGVKLIHLVGRLDMAGKGEINSKVHVLRRHGKSRRGG